MLILKFNKKFVLTVCVTLFISTFLYGQNLSLLDSLQNQFNIHVYKDFNHAELVAAQIDSLSKINSSSEKVTNANLNFAILNLLKKDFKNARLFSKKVLANIDASTTEITKIKIFNIHAYLEYVDMYPTSAITYSEKAIKLAENLNSKALIAQSYITRANICIGQQQFNLARSYLNKAIKILDEERYDIEKTDLYFSYGKSFYISQKDSALIYYQKALKSALNVNKLYKQGEIYADMAFIKLYNSETDGVKPLLNNAESIAKQVGHNALLHNIYYTYGYYFWTLEDYNTAVLNYKTAVDDYGKFVELIQLSNTYQMLSYSSYYNNNLEDAFHYQGEHAALNDSIFNIKKAKEFETIKTKYEVEKKDNQIILLEKENELADTKRKQIILVSIFTSIILIGLFLFYRQRAKTQKRIRAQDKILFTKETLRLQKEQELVVAKSLIKGQDDERHRIAKELHDGIGGRLSSATIALFNFNTEQKSDKVSLILNNLKTTFKELRLLSHSLSDTYHNTKTLDVLVNELQQNYETQNIFKVEVTVFPENALKVVSKMMTHHIYRILQELMNNTNKYANATEVQLTFDFIEDDLTIIYEDNGIGFDLESIKQNKSIGLKNIEERVLSLNGKLYIDTKKGRGVHFSIELPLINDITKTIS